MKPLIGNKNIQTNIYKTRAKDSVMHGCFVLDLLCILINL